MSTNWTKSLSANLYVCKQKNCGQETKFKIPFEILPPSNYLVIIHMDILNLHKYSTFFQYQKVMVEKSSERPVFLVYHPVVNFPIFPAYSFEPARVVSSMQEDNSRGVAQRKCFQTNVSKISKLDVIYQ